MPIKYRGKAMGANHGGRGKGECTRTPKQVTDGREVSASGWGSGGPRFQSHPRRTFQSCSRYQLNQLGSKAASESTFKQSNTCGVSNTRFYFYVRHCGLVGSAGAWDGTGLSSIPGSVRYISHVHKAYDYPPVPSGFYGYIWLDTKIVLKKRKIKTTLNWKIP